MTASVLVIGSGGREHALSWKLAESSDVMYVFVTPGNAGTEDGKKVSNVHLNVREHELVIDWCLANRISLVVIGPEDPLADGLSDSLNRSGIQCFGPSAAAARIESSKEFAKDFMNRHDIPTARWAAFTDCREACQFIESADFPALVVKASGLAAGKGVIVASNNDEAINAVTYILEGHIFGNAGRTIIVEELLIGEEISFLAFSDGQSIVCMPPTQDHKRLLNGDKGPNTGGMGAYCPCTLMSEADLDRVKKDILQRTVDALRRAGTPFVGVLYAGIMLTKVGPKVLEFNCRFGDPETQVILQLLKTDLYKVISHCVEGRLNSIAVEFDLDSSALGVVLASSGYPNDYPKGLPITGVESAESKYGVNVFYAGVSSDGDTIVTSGGRVLTIISKASFLLEASQQAQLAAKEIVFDGKQYRSDIGFKALAKSVCRLTYKDSGVDIIEGDRLVNTIKPLAAATVRLGCCPELGLFGGMFDMKAINYADPLLISGTDGVGTKLKISQSANIYDTVGIDLVAMCVNDVLCHGAEPLFFLDYFACGKLDVRVARDVIEGISFGCQQAGCALLGGETAEMPGMYDRGEYDLAGFAVGAVERHNLLPNIESIKEGDVVIGLTSSGIHSNGFSLVRKIVEKLGIPYDSTCPFDRTKTLGQGLLTATKIYVKSLLPVLTSDQKVKALAHITGGGIPGNVERILPKHLCTVLDASRWVIPPVFGWLYAKGNLEPSEMSYTFNCGLGMVAVINQEHVSDVVFKICELGEQAVEIGRVLSRNQGSEAVQLINLSEALKKSYKILEDVESHSLIRTTIPSKKRVAVLISGSGTNLQALIDFTKDARNKSSAEIVFVVSNLSYAFGLQRANVAGISCQVISHKDFKTREDFDDAVHQQLIANNIDIVCLAGFMRILSGSFVNKWKGRLLNIHPSLLPSFKGAHAHKLALDAGVRVSGCTVHFVSEEVDAGAIIVQEAVPVLPGDTEETLSERVKVAEHLAFPKALELVSSGKLILDDKGRIVWK